LERAFFFAGRKRKNGQFLSCRTEKDDKKKSLCPLESIMVHVEILNYGILPGSPGATPGILGRSMGITQDLADEITRLCKGWGQPPVAGTIRPAILSFPLKSRPKFASKGAFAVIRVQGDHELIFQVAVVSTSDYATFGYNPFALIEGGALPEWNPTEIPGRRTLQPSSGPLDINPAPSQADVGLIDEALHQILTTHKLHFPIERATEESDRCLSLLLEVLPEDLKRQLRFASYAPSTANAYHLAANATVECEFSGWKRLMMTLVGGVLPQNQARYVKKVRDCLAFGDIKIVRTEGRLLSLEPHQEPAKKVVKQGSRIPAVDTNKPAITTKNLTASLSGAQHPPLPPRPGLKPKVQRAYNQAEVRSPQLAQLRGANRRLSGLVVVLLVVTLSLAGGGVYFEFFHDGDLISWSELVSWPGMRDKQQENRVNSLLEVANVGAVYNNQLKRINRSKLIPGLNAETTQTKGLAQLKTEAASPLLGQVDLFVNLVASGIRQGSRPDRESNRLKALADQGHVLDVEMARLELAWHSLSCGANWADLARLRDQKVFARRDSLKKSNASSLEAAAGEMGFRNRQEDLRLALVQSRGMSQLVVLFQEPQWSPQWEIDLYRAAEQVSPAASAMTRAYRNSAFSMVRLKQAEHQAEFTGAAFCDHVKNGIWPTETVAEILPQLRRQILKFKHNETPLLLAETMSWYKHLEKPETLVDDLAKGRVTLKSLRDNGAYRFDPKAYNDYLERIRHQAALACDLLGGKNPDLVVKSDSPFLQRWTQHEKEENQQEFFAVSSRFEATWALVENQIMKVDDLAVQGKDWTGVWVDLDRDVRRGLADGAMLASRDETMIGRVKDLERLQRSMTGARPLELGLATVRLDQELLTGQQTVVFEFQALPNGPVQRSEPFTLGPAAPAGSGWVGTTKLTAQPLLSPVQPFQGVVRLVDDGRELFRVEYPSLRERVGPGALVRPRSGQGGSLSIKTSDRWWRGLHLPQLGAQNGPS
jgi:hypothetical protein